MALRIRRAAVLGSGVMGSQIAAHLAAAGVRTYVLDLCSKEPPTDPKLHQVVGKNFRSSAAILAIEGLKALKPSPLMYQKVLDLLIPGNFEDDMAVLADSDWIIEAVVERPDVKQKIHAQIAEFAKPHVPITTNTSGISITEMAKNFPEHLVCNFFGSHFFNPPRYLKLVELIPHSETNIELMKALGHWIHERLGKGIVYGNDTPNFIANRIGVLNLQSTVKHMEKANLSISTVDALTGKLIGRPASATFRTLDVVGLDTYAHTARNVLQGCPDDPFRNDFKMAPWIEGLIAKGHLGQKSQSVGCYKKSKDAKGRSAILALNLRSGEYEAQEPQQVEWLKEAMSKSSALDRWRFILTQSDETANFLQSVLVDTLAYSSYCLQDIASGDPRALDQAMKWGFNWEYGPFEIWQSLGFNLMRERILKAGHKLPAWCKEGLRFYSPAPDSDEWLATGPTFALNALNGTHQAIERPTYAFHLPQKATKTDNRVVYSNEEASLVDIGHGIAALVFHSKMNAISPTILDASKRAIGTVSEKFNALVIANEGPQFSAGANLKVALDFVTQGDFKRLEGMIRDFQALTQLIKFAPFPVISCPHGLTLGGGCEIALHSHKQVLYAETYAGLVEIGVGLVPAAGGTKELALRAYETVERSENGDPSAFLARAFQLIGMAKVSTSAADAVEMGLFPESAQISLSFDHLVIRAKENALQMLAAGFIPKQPRQRLKVLGDPGIQTFSLQLYNMEMAGFISAYDRHIGEKIAGILCGGPVDGGSIVSEQFLLELEREAIFELCRDERTQARIGHMLKTGKALRN